MRHYQGAVYLAFFYSAKGVNLFSYKTGQLLGDTWSLPSFFWSKKGQNGGEGGGRGTAPFYGSF